MASRLIIKFPFQSVNDEQYVIALHTQSDGNYAEALIAMDADTECFRHISDTIDGKYHVYEYEGMLCGSVTAEDDDRDDLFTPLATSKLKFNIACQQFPLWLMKLCTQVQSVKVVLYAVTNNETNQLRERWRGYLLANTLNMTVVDDKMACPLVAIDELGAAKYMPFRANMTPRRPVLALYILMRIYWQMQWNEFLQVYTDLGLATNQAAIYFSRNMELGKTDSRNEVDILWKIFINLERYYLDEDATWQNVIHDVCQYLGVHMEIGGYANNHNYDNYIMSSYDSGQFQTGAYTLHYISSSYSYITRYAQLGNQQKIGANLQVTVDPDKYKGVEVSSLPERPPKHDYLQDKNMRVITPAAGRGDYVEVRIGHLQDQQGQQLKYWRLQYAEIVTDEKQWTDESDYIKLENCQVSTEGRAVGGSGYYPMTDAPLGRNKPNGEDTDSLEFVAEKKGMIPIKLGSFDFIHEMWPTEMTNYLMLLNNVWGRKYWDGDDHVNTDISQPFKVATLYPFGLDRSLITADKAYLAIDFSALFTNENIGKAAKIFEWDNAWINDLKGRKSVIFPMTSAFNNYEDGQDDTYGALSGDTGPNRVIYATSFLTCRLRIGNWFYSYDWTDASLRGWTYYEDPDEAPTFRLPVNAADVDYWDLVNGARAVMNVKNYYYVDSHPRSRVVDKKFLVPLEGLSTMANQLSGRVELEIYWPVPYLNYYQSTLASPQYYNNILAILINDIDIAFTDEAENQNADIELVEKVETDPNSTTKEMKELSLKLASPKVPGVFANCLIYDNGDNMVYVRDIHEQGGSEAFTPEHYIANAMAQVYNRPATWVEFSRFFAAADYGDVANLEFRVSGLTEAAGTFVPVERKFDFTRSLVRWKLQQLSTT